MRHYYGRYNIGVLGFFYNTFIASMILVVTVHNALAFLIVWECMSLASYFLVIYERNEAANIRAGTLYFVMTHVGTAFILLAFIMMYTSTGSLDFAAIQRGLVTASPVTCSAIFLCALDRLRHESGHHSRCISGCRPRIRPRPPMSRRS